MNEPIPLVGSQKRLVPKDAPATAGAVNEGPLAQKLQAHVAEHGSLSSGDVAAFTRSAEEPLAEDKISKPSAVTVDEQTSQDPLVVKAGADGAAGLSSAASAKSDAKKKVLVITPEEKDAFIDALIHNKRFSLPFSFYGGKLRVVVRSRTVRESQAIVAAERLDLENKRIVTNLDYTMRLRAMLLTAQIEEFNGVVQPLLTEPLQETLQADGSVMPPPWLSRVDYWLKQNEAMVATLWQAVEEFEAKYWKMVEDSRDSNFLNPAASSSV